MRSKFIIVLLFMSGAVSLISACDKRVCQNSNPVFDKYLPENEQYKTELIHQLKKVQPEETRYWFANYEVRAGKEYLYFDVQSEGLCATLVLQVDDWEKLQNLRIRKGVSYRGAEFVNLRYKILSDSLGTNLILKDFDRIVD